MTCPELLWRDNGTAIDLTQFWEAELGYSLSLAEVCLFLPERPPWPCEWVALAVGRVVPGWLVRSLHSLISELIEMKTHRQQ